MARINFRATRKRGAALAREILDQIEAERKITRGNPTVETNTWNQGTWARLHTNALNGHVFKVTLDEDNDPQLIAPRGIDCGTAMCFAGHATRAVGDRFVVPFYSSEYGENEKLPKKLTAVEIAELVPHDSLGVFDVITKDGDTVDISSRAAELLELEPNEAGVLFHYSNTIGQLRSYVDMMEQGLHLATGEKKLKRL